MRVTIAHHTRIPVQTYGGTERIMWWLGKELVKMGHEVTYLVNPGSSCSFAKLRELRKNQSLNHQIPRDSDMVHLFFQPKEEISFPYLVTNQGNVPDKEKHIPLDQNTVFVSRNHAERHNAQCYVYNGIDVEDYGNPHLNLKRNYFHFLAKATWRAKNLIGAIKLAQGSHEKLHVLGGSRWNPRMGINMLNPNLIFHGMTGGYKKNEVLSHSKGLLFPVLWHEPFGIAMIESLYFGCPVFGTTYGSLPELIPKEVGFLSNKVEELIKALQNMSFDHSKCQQYVLNNFTSRRMAKDYLNLYEKVLSEEKLNQEAPTAAETKNEYRAITKF